MSGWLTAWFGAVLVVLTAGGPALAQEAEDTLAKIRESGRVVVGYRESSVPFSYYDGQGRVVGYAQFYSDLIIDAIKKELGEAGLKVEYLPITSSNRIDLLREGRYDFECGSTTNNTERQRLAAFSNTFFIVGTRLLVHKDSEITYFDDLAGKRVAVTSGTTSEQILLKMNEEKNMNITVISAKDHGDAFAALENGRADAFFIDDALLAGERAKAVNPEKWVIVGEPQSYEAYGCMFRKDDPRFKALLDEVISEAQSSGAALKAYNQWFHKPIPPNGVNLDFELSSVMKELFAAPNDRAYQ